MQIGLRRIGSIEGIGVLPMHCSATRRRAFNLSRLLCDPAKRRAHRPDAEAGESQILSPNNTCRCRAARVLVRRRLNDGVQTPTARSWRTAAVEGSAHQRRVVAIGRSPKTDSLLVHQWKTSALTRLILANSQGGYATNAAGRHGGSLVPRWRPFTLRAYADSCGQTAKHETEGPASTKGSAKPKKQYQSRSPEINHE